MTGVRHIVVLCATVFVFLLGCGSDELSSADPPGGGPPVEGEGFVAHYYSSWANPHMHFAIEGSWTEPPGQPMSAEGDGWHVYQHEQGAGGVEFVFNDGGETWDNNGGQNYFTDLYEFWVRDGEIYDSPPGGPGAFCSTVDCGNGTCNEAERRCDCDPGYLYEADLQTCVEDLCAGVQCGQGELCDPEDGTCIDACTPDRVVGDFRFCTITTKSSYAVTVVYDGAGQLDLGASDILLNGASVDLSGVFEAATQTFWIQQTGVESSKYSYLFRMKNDGGADIRPLFVPMWIGNGVRYADFTWKDGILYQIMTDRFLNGDGSNDIDNSQGTLAQVTDVRSQWQGGDFRGIIDKIEDGYFESMGINVLWISSPLLNSHNSQPAVDLGDPLRYSSYHSYHPIVTGYTHLDDLGYSNPIETAFGTPAELHELVNKAHQRGIRVVPDFVANHVQSEAQIYQDHPEWFFPYNPCDGNWDAHRIDCWFTTEMPDFDYEGNPAAVQAVVDHAIWLIQEFNFDGFRADALKHMSDSFVRALKTAVMEQIETRVDDHAMSEEPTVFYMVGESLGGWARYHVRADMVQGQVDEEYYNRTKAALLTLNNSIRDLANFAIPNDTAYLTPQEIFGQQAGYPGAVMGNFFGNHDQVRALTEAGGDYARLRMAQTFLMTSPGNIPMLYQGDDIGTYGGIDPDNRAMQRFSGLSGEETASLNHARAAGTARNEHAPLRRGTRQNEVLEDWFWVYRVSYQGEDVYVALNRDAIKSYSPPAGYTDVLGNCSGGQVPSMSSCIFVAP
jgi:glycosidase